MSAKRAAYLYYVMELADDHVAGRDRSARLCAEDLKDRVRRHRRLSADECVRLGLCLTAAFMTLHAQGLAHRDIKPANIIFVGGTPKMADIGLVAASGQDSFVGTEGYVPPEGPGTPQADIYSLGKVLYEISDGEGPARFSRAGHAARRATGQGTAVAAERCVAEGVRERARAALPHREGDARRSGVARWRARPWARLALASSVRDLVAGGPALVHRETAGRVAPPTIDPVARLTITTEPPGAMVLLGDQMKKSPATFTDLEPRKYGLRVMLPGYDPVETKVSLEGQGTLDLPVVKLQRSQGAVEVQTEPAGRAVRILSEAGELVREGAAPLALAALATGKYEVTASEGEWQLREQVEVRRAETARVLLAFVTVPVEISSEPGGAQVSADGKPLGRAPLRVELPVGEHEVTAKLDGWPEQHRSITIERGREAAAQFVFRNGSVKITSAPGGAQVFQNEQQLGQTPLLIEEVPPGDVRYELRLKDHKTVPVTGQVEPEQQTFLAARLEKELRPDPSAPWTNSLGLKLVPVDGVRMAVHETRVQDFETFCSATGRQRELPGFTQTPAHPVVKVNWFDAVAFCKWLTEKERAEGLLDETQSYRLPTDLEWSAAAGLSRENGSTPELRDGKVRNVFPWGTEWPPPPGAGNYAVIASSPRRGDRSGDQFAQTAPVGQFQSQRARPLRSRRERLGVVRGEL